jgi:hypothetical protein
MALLDHLDDDKRPEKKWREKQSHLQRLPDRPLAIAAVLCSGRKVLTFSIDTIRGLFEGAEKLAEWLD